MIFFSPAKINIGLQIIERRKDGFHNLQSIMFAIGLCDIFEIRKSSKEDQKIQFLQSGVKIDAPAEMNLCMKAWELFTLEAPLPPVEIHLHKQIPVGAGLGGGSSNASTTLFGLNTLAGNPLSEEKLQELAAILGSDCPFFLHKNPMLMEGRGEKLSSIPIHLDQLYLVLLFPEISISTAKAYAGVKPATPAHHLRELIKEPLHLWKEMIINDFELSIFERYPELKQMKQTLYKAGAVYASLSGSGSSLYGFFHTPPDLPGEIEKYVIWKGKAVRIT